MTYKIKKKIILPYGAVVDMKDALMGILSGSMDSVAIFGFVADNLPWIEKLVGLNFYFTEDTSANDLDLLEDVLPMAKDLIQAVVGTISKEVEAKSYKVHIYNEDFSSILGEHSTEKFRVSLGIVEDVMTAVADIQRTGKIDAEKVDELMEDIEDGILRSFPALKREDLIYMDTMEIVALYKTYFSLGLSLLSKKKGPSPKQTQGQK